MIPQTFFSKFVFVEILIFFYIRNYLKKKETKTKTKTWNDKNRGHPPPQSGLAQMGTRGTCFASPQRTLCSWRKQSLKINERKWSEGEIMAAGRVIGTVVHPSASLEVRVRIIQTHLITGSIQTRAKPSLHKQPWR